MAAAKDVDVALRRVSKNIDWKKTGHGDDWCLAILCYVLSDVLKKWTQPQTCVFLHFSSFLNVNAIDATTMMVRVLVDATNMCFQKKNMPSYAIICHHDKLNHSRSWKVRPNPNPPPCLGRDGSRRGQAWDPEDFLCGQMPWTCPAGWATLKHVSWNQNIIEKLAWT